MFSKSLFYRINNFLLIVFLILIVFILYSQSDETRVYSQTTSQQPNSSTRSQLQVINRDAKIKLDLSSFTVNYVSDGYTSSIDEAGKSKFRVGNNGGSGQYNAIPIPVKFSFNPDASNVVMPGEIVFPAIPKTSAPRGFQCVERGSPLDNEENQKNCFFNVTMYALFTDTISSGIRLGEKDIRYNKDTNQNQEQGNIFTKLVDFLVNIDYQLGKVIVDSGFVDQSRSAVGVVRMWGSDDLQQIVSITPSEGGILTVKTIIDSTAVNVSEGLFANDLNPVLSSKSVIAYKQPNVLRKKYFETIFNATPSNTLGAGEIYDPFTNEPEDKQTNKSFTQIVAEGIFNFITGSSTLGTLKQEKLAAHVPVRPLAETTSYSVKYNLCDAFSQRSDLFNYLRDYPNPIRRPASKYLEDGVTINPEYVRWENYEGLSSKIKRCIDGLAKHVNDSVAQKCAIQLADDPGAGCDEFSVEEEDLKFEPLDYTFPVGLGAYFQNSYLNTINPTLKGPYLNYLSTHLCAKLNLSFNVKPEAQYIYHVGTAGGTSSAIRDSRGRVLSADVLNQYCIVGGVLSNFSWAMTQQLQYFSARPSDKDLFSMPKEALTCDKKEIAYFGADPVETNIPTVNGEPVYITGDNVRGGRSGTNDELVIWHGYDVYPLTQIMQTELKDRYLYEYRDYRLHVLNDLNSRRPKYVVTPVRNGKDSMSLYLCKLPSKLLTQNLQKDQPKQQKKYCIEVTRGRFVLVYGSALATMDGLDAITIVFNDPNAESGKPSTHQYSYVYVTNPFDLSEAIVTPPKDILTKSITETNIESVQLKDGSLAISYVRKGSTKFHLGEIGAMLFNPFTGVRIVKDASGNIKVERNSDDGLIRTDNLCDKYRNYCDYLTLKPEPAFIRKFEMTQAPSGIIYIALTVPGKGLVFSVDPTDITKSIKPFIFHFKKSNNPDASGYDPVVAIKGSPDGDLHVFLGRSGDYLQLLMSESWLNRNIYDRLAQIDLGDGISCRDSCVAVIQSTFDPDLFVTDCSDYNGSGACGAPRLNKLGPPIVHSFDFTSNGDIRALYTHQGLGKTLLESWDYLYAMNGVYSPIVGEDNTEVSNVYIPSGTGAKPIRYFNSANGGLQVGVDVEPVVGGYKEKLLFNSLGSNISTTFRGFNRDKKIEKIECLREYSKLQSNGDMFYKMYGLNPIDLSVISLQDRVIDSSSTSESTSSSSSSSSNSSSSVISGAFSSNNSGEYCEETWCIPDEVQFIGGGEFADDARDENLKNRIANAIPNGQQKKRYIDIMCDIASQKNVSCAFVAAIWVAESSASTSESPKNPAFGCMLGTSPYCTTGPGVGTDYCRNWYTFENQVKCAVNSLTNLYNDAKKRSADTRILSGPSDRVGKPYLTNEKRGGGKCKAGTIFSYVMQKYTPIDRRINNDNQCNQGLVRRDGQDKFCAGILPASSTRNSEKVSYLPDVWGEAIITRPNIQKTLLKIDPRLRADNNRCYPNSLIGETDKPSTNKNIAVVLDQYDLSLTEKVGEVRLGLYKWGSSEAAGNVYMALRMLNNGKLEGVHVIPPGGEFSFNDTIGNPTAKDVERLWTQLQNIQAPWNKGQKFKRDGSTVIGGGWCDLATGIRMAAEDVIGSNGTKLKQTQFKNRSELFPPTSSSYGTGGGYQGDINHWTHSGATLYDSYNRFAISGPKMSTNDNTKFVVIWTNPGRSQGWDDGDLVLKNPYTRESGIDMIITVSLDDQGVITIKVMFGRKKS